MIDKMQGAKWGYINEKQEPEPIPEKYQELIEIREKAVAEHFFKIINMYQKELEYMTTERNMYASILADLQEWVEAEMSELMNCIYSSEDTREAIGNQMAIYQKVADKVNELVGEFNKLVEE